MLPFLSNSSLLTLTLHIFDVKIHTNNTNNTNNTIIIKVQVASNYRQGTGGRKSAPIIGRAVNQMLDFLTSARQKKSGQDGRVMN